MRKFSKNYSKLILKIGFLLIAALVSVLCSSCCKTCLIANSELSDINTGFYKSRKNVTTITSNNKSIKIAPVNGGQIISYSFADENILAPIYEQISIISAYEQKSIKFKDHCKFLITKPDTVLLTNTIDPSYNLTFLQKYRMNLDNGDVFISQNLRSSSDKQHSLYLSNKTFLKSDGYIIIPLSVISKLPNRWQYLNSKADNLQTNSVHLFDDKLIVHASGEDIRIGTDSVSDWFAYMRGDLLFVKKFSYGDRGKYRDNYRIKINSTQNSLVVETPGPLLELKPNEHKTFLQKWTIIKLDNPVNSFKSAIRAFNSLYIHMLLNR